MKDKIIKGLIEIGKKCKVLLYPVMFVMVLFLSLYHFVTGLFKSANKHIVATRALGGLLVLALLVGGVVLPAMADENLDNDQQIEQIDKEALEEETPTPQVTPTPEIKEDSQEENKEENKEEVEETKEIKEENEENEENEEAKEDSKDGQEDKNTENLENLTKGSDESNIQEETARDESNEEDNESEGRLNEVNKLQTIKESNIKLLKNANSDVELNEPVFKTQPVGTSWDYMDRDEDYEMFIELDNVLDEYYVDYQWYKNGEAIDGATKRKYSVSKNSGAGDFNYTCKVTYSLSSDGDKVSNTSEAALVKINKIAPVLDDFIFEIPSNLDYTGEEQIIAVSVKDGIKGMGNAKIVAFEDNTRKRLCDPGTYTFKLDIDEGNNYNADILRIEDKECIITQIDTPAASYTISGTKGNIDSQGKQWYKSDVSIIPPNGYYISDADNIKYKEILTYTEEGSNVGPSAIRLKKKSSGGITNEIEVPYICIDKTLPSEIQFSYTNENGELITENDNKFSSSVATIAVTANDNITGADDLVYEMAISPSKTTSYASLSWSQTKEITVTDLENYVVYCKVTDEAGNTSAVVESNGIVIDANPPVITCGNNAIKEKYIADEKTFTVSDENLQSVKVDEKTVTYRDIENGSYDFTLKASEISGKSKEHTIVAIDFAGNKLTQTITMVNPMLDVTVSDMNFGEQKYGYDAQNLQRTLSLAKGSDYNIEEDPVIESVKSLSNADSSYFIYDDVNKTIVPKAKLPVREAPYEEIFRIEYSGSETESSITFKCSLTVTKAVLSVTYVGNLRENGIADTATNGAIPYHAKTEKFLNNALDVTGFVYDESLDYLKENDENFKMPTITSSQANAIEDETIVPNNDGRASNYEFSCTSGEMQVADRRQIDGYIIDGSKGENDWYTSAVGIVPIEGYSLGQDEATIGNTNRIAVPTLDDGDETDDGETPGQNVSFYVMNNDTQEISLLTSLDFKIDTSAPEFAENEGIRVSNDLFKEFLNFITFGQYFNDKKEVSISAHDDMSGIDKIQYAILETEAGQKDVGEFKTRDESGSIIWNDYGGNSFSLEPKDVNKIVIYAKVTNKAGLVSYISSDGFIIDSEAPEISEVNDTGNGKIPEYIVEEKEIKVEDKNLKEVTLYTGTDTSVAGENMSVDSENGQSLFTLSCPEEGSTTYTIVATDTAGNLAEKSLKITKPIYDIVAENLVIPETNYGYEETPKKEISWKNTEQANADATISSVSVSDKEHFKVLKDEDTYYVSLQNGLDSGKYRTNMVLVYNNGKEAECVCSAIVKKAKLLAKYIGQSVKYHEMPDYENTIKVSGFVNSETEDTAAEYQAPYITPKTIATQTTTLKPEGGSARNYEFEYESGVLKVERSNATKGKEYDISGELSDTGWYISDITITPSNGYVLSFDEEGKETTDKIVIKKDTDSGQQIFYLKNENTGELSNKVVFNYQKDCLAPEFKDLEDGQTYKVNSKDIEVYDDYLANVNANGSSKEVDLTSSKFTIYAENEKTLYVMTASDRAGNVTNITIILSQPSTIDEESEVEQVDASAATTAGLVKKNTQVKDGAPETTISSSIEDVAKATLDDGEKKAVKNGSNADIELIIKNIDGSVSQSDKELIISSLGEYIVGEYLDITLWKTVGDSAAKQLHNANSLISVTVTVPSVFRNTDSQVKRQFAVLRIHNGAVTVLDDRDAVENTVTIATDKFSTYALVYKDVEKSSVDSDEQEEDSDSTSGNRSKSGSSSKSGSGSGSGSSSSASGPETGDNSPIIPIVIVLICAIIGIATILVIKNKKNK